jgi:hypothetical protein
MNIISSHDFLIKEVAPLGAHPNSRILRQWKDKLTGFTQVEFDI